MPNAFAAQLNSRRFTPIYNLRLLHKHFTPNTNVNPIYNDFLATEFKLVYKTNLTIKKSTTDNYTKPVAAISVIEQLRLFKMFKSFLRVTSASNSTLTIPHFSFRHFYLGYRRGGLAVLNLSKLFNR